MPKEKRPPISIWDNEKEIEMWLDNLYQGQSNTTNLIVNESEIEG